MRSRFWSARYRTVVVAGVLALGLSACGSSGDVAGVAAPTRTAQPEAAAPGGGGLSPAVLQFRAPLLTGGVLDGTTFTGKPVAFWFWAPW